MIVWGIIVIAVVITAALWLSSAKKVAEEEGPRVRRRMLWADKREVVCSDQTCRARFRQKDWKFECPVCASKLLPRGFVNPFSESPFDGGVFDKRRREE